MSFLIQRVTGRGLTLAQIRNPVLRIGRGTNAELRSENPAVALEHAVIEKDAHGYVITDRGSITGTYVNRKPVENARLAKGDVIEIGDLRIEVQVAELAKPLFLRVAEAQTTAIAVDDDEADTPRAPAGAGVVRARKIDYAHAYRLARPYFTRLTITGILLIVAFVVVGEVIRPEHHENFMPGTVSEAHKRAGIAQRCDACHTPFNSVSNEKCRDCHAQAEHAKTEAVTPDCFSCHAEHRGDAKLASAVEVQCASCHADLTQHVKPGVQLAADRARIDAFGGNHPELHVARDANTLRFNHRLHLDPKGIFNEKAKREVLQCRSCHDLVETKDKLDPVKLSFDAHCRRCHQLTFDARFPTAEVPHGGDSGIAYGFIIGMYAGDRDLVGRPAAEVRRILTRRSVTSLDDRAVQSAKHTVDDKCGKCHELTSQRSLLVVKPPLITSDWLPRAKFSHGKHRDIDCESCHREARGSASTSDVAMPKITDCTGCHAANAKKAQTASTCRDCHEYHLQPKTASVVQASLATEAAALGRGGRMLQGVLLAAAVVLLLVILIPVGLALFQRLKPKPAERAPASPRAPMPDIPTAKVPGMQAPPIQQPPMAAPDVIVAASDATMLTDATMMTSLPNAKGGVSGGTEVVEWYGSLLCSAGALEGQRWIIEGDGFYIGRDATLSKVVVADSRVSKRHVRIVPRDGKVYAIDQSSTNGTFLNKQRITEVQLKKGDVLVLADDVASFLYQI
ncbi:MAG TPA: FHA domain-containing protein [Thermoanaerobaculia bacterium]